MANHSRWADIKARGPTVPAETRSVIVQGFSLVQLIYDLRTELGVSQRELAQRMGTTQSVISFPVAVPAKLNDAVQVA